MLETERSSDEALREPTYRRLYLGALEIDNSERQLKACYIILLAGRMGLRTGEIQHVREEWIDWDRGEIAIPRYDPCGCVNCWIRATAKANREDDKLRDEVRELLEDRIGEDPDQDVDDVLDEIIREEAEVLEELTDEDDEDTDEDVDDRSAEEILYEERWQPKYPRSARRVPFGHSRRLTAVIKEFIDNYEYLQITQVSMNNLVEEAAENADGVNPENVTIRGLRATAATQYATYIRNPKALQDLMGWTRIETAVRYLRRAGAFTTDVVYNAFDKGDIAPAMFPGEPDEQFPIINNPLPYQKEPFDPMLWPKDLRQDFGREQAKQPRQLIHYRSQHHPDDVDYDPDNHQILTHEDYEDDIINRGGLTVFESPTLKEFYADHERFPEADIDPDEPMRKYESAEEWEEYNTRQMELDEVAREDGEYRSLARSFLPAFINRYFASVDWVGKRFSKAVRKWVGDDVFASPASAVKRTLVTMFGIAVLVSATVGILVIANVINLQTMTIKRPRLALGVLGFALFSTYKISQGNPLSEMFK